MGKRKHDITIVENNNNNDNDNEGDTKMINVDDSELLQNCFKKIKISKISSSDLRIKNELEDFLKLKNKQIIVFENSFKFSNYVFNKDYKVILCYDALNLSFKLFINNFDNEFMIQIPKHYPNKKPLIVLINCPESNFQLNKWKNKNIPILNPWSAVLTVMDIIAELEKLCI